MKLASDTLTFRTLFITSANHRRSSLARRMLRDSSDLAKRSACNSVSTLERHRRRGSEQGLLRPPLLLKNKEPWFRTSRCSDAPDDALLRSPRARPVREPSPSRRIVVRGVKRRLLSKGPRGRCREQIRSTPASRARHIPRCTSTDAQVIPYATTPYGRNCYAVSPLTPKRSLVQSQYRPPAKTASSDVRRGRLTRNLITTPARGAERQLSSAVEPPSHRSLLLRSEDLRSKRGRLCR